MGRWRASCSGSPAASRPTRPASSCAFSSRRATTCCRCRRAAADRFVRTETFFALARKSAEHRSLPAPRARRPARDRPAHGEHAREARARPRRRRPHRGGARAPRADARRAGDEHAHVGARGDPGERGDSARARGRADRPGGRRARGRRGRRRPDERAGGNRAPDRGAARRDGRLAHGHARPRQRGRDARAGRRGAFSRQPLLGPHGRRASPPRLADAGRR